MPSSKRTIEINDDEKQKESKDDDFGFPHVHKVFAKYKQDNGVACEQATHLVLYAKKK